MALYSNPFFYSPAPGLFSPASDKMTVHQKMRLLGLNTGNMMFATALQKVLGPTEGCDWGATLEAFDPRAVAEKHDCIVIAAANWLQPRLDFGPLATKIEETGLPCFVIGIGAQAGSFNSAPELLDGTKRFLKVVSERSTEIAVRGPFTAEVLESHGITNVCVSGCPSLLMASHAPISKISTPIRKIAIAGSRGLPNERIFASKTATQLLSRRFSKMLLTDDVEFIAQAELPEIEIALSDARYDGIRPEWLDFIERYYEAPIADVAPALAKKMKVFFNMDDWIDHLRTVDFVFGTRLHGTIVSLIAGTPALMIVHDSRTREMAEIMNIPAIAAKEIDGPIDYQSLYDSIDLDRFIRRLPEYVDRYISFFDCNGLKHNLYQNA